MLKGIEVVPPVTQLAQIGANSESQSNRRQVPADRVIPFHSSSYTLARLIEIVSDAQEATVQDQVEMFCVPLLYNPCNN